MTDKELLELAAKAAKIPGKYISLDDGNNSLQVGVGDLTEGWWWNPLANDGDALRLAVKLEMDICINDDGVNIVTAIAWGKNIGRHESVELFSNDQYSATRRAIVRTAAEIGKEMK